MVNLFGKFLKAAASPFLGKGIIDKHFPLLITIYQNIYAKSQKDVVSEVDIPFGLRLKVFSSDIGVGLPLLTKGKYEEMQTAHFAKTLKPGNVVLDIGANVGYYSLIASKLVGDSGGVYSFEPDPNNFSLLRQNLDLNKCKNVEAFNLAVANEDKDMFFKVERYNKGESSLAQKDEGLKVKGVSIDSFVKKHGLSRVNIVKMDIEGAEILALKGAQETFRKNRLSLYIEYNPSRLKLFEREPKLLLAKLKELGFEIKLIIDESRTRVIDYSENNLENVLSHTTYCSLFCQN